MCIRDSNKPVRIRYVLIRTIATHAYETQVNTARRLAPAQEVRAYAADNRPPAKSRDKRSQTPNQGSTRCFRCNDPSHKTSDCKIKKESVTCGKCNKPGHLTKACRGIGKPLVTAKQAIAESLEEQEFTTEFTTESLPEYANAIRTVSYTHLTLPTICSV